MPNYRRMWMPGGSYFFTVTLLERHHSDLLVRYIDLLRTSVLRVRRRRPFVIHAWVVLPEHLHCLVELPAGDADYATRWMLIKQSFAKSLPKIEFRNAARLRRQERGIWQRRYWEHVIRDDEDWHRHLDYLHYNPVKHGHVQRVSEWPHSSFHRFVRRGIYPIDWTTPRCVMDIEHE
jgi:putative transposase